MTLATITQGNDALVSQGGNVIAVQGAVNAPMLLTSPQITGTFYPGQTLTCSTGSWTGAPMFYLFQWTINGLVMPGQTQSTYVVQFPDYMLGPNQLGCVVVAYNGMFSPPAIVPLFVDRLFQFYPGYTH